MNKVISFSLWGDNPIYNVGAIRNAELAKQIYPEWTCWYYVGTNTPTETIEKLKSFDNTKVIEMGVVGDWTGMFWRFYPASENDVDVFISRDSDSRVDLREKSAVDEWLSSDKKVHIMRDHPYHQTFMLGGMWGAKKGTILDIKQKIDFFFKVNTWGVDQNFLNQIIYPYIQNDIFVHDEYFSLNKDKHNFPIPRNGSDFVGQRVDQFENRQVGDQASGFLSKV